MTRIDTLPRDQSVPRAQPLFGVRLLVAAWHLAQVGIALYGLGTLVFLIARQAIGERWALVALANNFIPWMAGLGVILALIGALSRWRWALIALQLPGVIAFAWLYGDLLWPPDTSAAPDTPRLTVATYNTFYPGTDPARVVDVLAALDADVIGIQELGHDQATEIEARLAAEYPYRALRPGVSVEGVGLLSRYPILDAAPYRPFPGSMGHLRAVLELPGGPVVVYVAHPPPPSLSRSWGYDDGPRDAEIADLVARVQAESAPVIVACDCNMSDQSDAYRRVDRVLADAFREAGWGLGLTHGLRALTPFRRLVRIDYVWHDAHFRALEAAVHPDSGTSDHFPVVAELAIISPE